MPDKNEERIRNLGRGFCWMRPVDYECISQLRMRVEVDEKGSMLMIGGRPVLHYDGETVWADIEHWPGVVAGWSGGGGGGWGGRHSYSRRQKRALDRKEGVAKSVMNLCLPMHWGASLLPIGLTFRASERQALVSMPVGLQWPAPTGPYDPKLKAVELPKDFDLAIYHAHCAPPPDFGYSYSPSARSHSYLQGLSWRTIRRGQLELKQVPACPWDLPRHRNRSRQGFPK